MHVSFELRQQGATDANPSKTMQVVNACHTVNDICRRSDGSGFPFEDLNDDVKKHIRRMLEYMARMPNVLGWGLQIIKNGIAQVLKMELSPSSTTGAN